MLRNSTEEKPTLQSKALVGLRHLPPHPRRHPASRGFMRELANEGNRLRFLAIGF